MQRHEISSYVYRHRRGDEDDDDRHCSTSLDVSKGESWALLPFAAAGAITVAVATFALWQLPSLAACRRRWLGGGEGRTLLVVVGGVAVPAGGILHVARWARRRKKHRAAVRRAQKRCAHAFWIAHLGGWIEEVKQEPGMFVDTSRFLEEKARVQIIRALLARRISPQYNVIHTEARGKVPTVVPLLVEAMNRAAEAEHDIALIEMLGLSRNETAGGYRWLDEAAQLHLQEASRLCRLQHLDVDTTGTHPCCCLVQNNSETIGGLLQSRTDGGRWASGCNGVSGLRDSAESDGVSSARSNSDGAQRFTNNQVEERLNVDTGSREFDGGACATDVVACALVHKCWKMRATYELLHAAGAVREAVVKAVQENLNDLRGRPDGLPGAVGLSEVSGRGKVTITDAEHPQVSGHDKLRQPMAKGTAALRAGGRRQGTASKNKEMSRFHDHVFASSRKEADESRTCCLRQTRVIAMMKELRVVREKVRSRTAVFERLTSSDARQPEKSTQYKGDPDPQQDSKQQRVYGLRRHKERNRRDTDEGGSVSPETGANAFCEGEDEELCRYDPSPIAEEHESEYKEIDSSLRSRLQHREGAHCLEARSPRHRMQDRSIGMKGRVATVVTAGVAAPDGVEHKEQSGNGRTGKRETKNSEREARHDDEKCDANVLREWRVQSRLRLEEIINDPERGNPQPRQSDRRQFQQQGYQQQQVERTHYLIEEGDKRECSRGILSKGKSENEMDTRMQQSARRQVRGRRGLWTMGAAFADVAVREDERSPSQSEGVDPGVPDLESNRDEQGVSAQGHGGLEPPSRRGLGEAIEEEKVADVVQALVAQEEKTRNVEVRGFDEWQTGRQRDHGETEQERKQHRPQWSDHSKSSRQSIRLGFEQGKGDGLTSLDLPQQQRQNDNQRQISLIGARQAQENAQRSGSTAPHQSTTVARVGAAEQTPRQNLGHTPTLHEDKEATKITQGLARTRNEGDLLRMWRQQEAQRHRGPAESSVPHVGGEAKHEAETRRTNGRSAAEDFPKQGIPGRTAIRSTTAGKVAAPMSRVQDSLNKRRELAMEMSATKAVDCRTENVDGGTEQLAEGLVGSCNDNVREKLGTETEIKMVAAEGACLRLAEGTRLGARHLTLLRAQAEVAREAAVTAARNAALAAYGIPWRQYRDQQYEQDLPLTLSRQSVRLRILHHLDSYVLRKQSILREQDKQKRERMKRKVERRRAMGKHDLLPSCGAQQLRERPNGVEATPSSSTAGNTLFAATEATFATKDLTHDQCARGRAASPSCQGPSLSPVSPGSKTLHPHQDGHTGSVRSGNASLNVSLRESRHRGKTPNTGKMGKRRNMSGAKAATIDIFERGLMAKHTPTAAGSGELDPDLNTGGSPSSVQDRQGELLEKGPSPDRQQPFTGSASQPPQQPFSHVVHANPPEVVSAATALASGSGNCNTEGIRSSFARGLGQTSSRPNLEARGTAGPAKATSSTGDTSLWGLSSVLSPSSPYPSASNAAERATFAFTRTLAAACARRSTDDEMPGEAASNLGVSCFNECAAGTPDHHVPAQSSGSGPSHGFAAIGPLSSLFQNPLATTGHAASALPIGAGEDTSDDRRVPGFLSASGLLPPPENTPITHCGSACTRTGGSEVTGVFSVPFPIPPTPEQSFRDAESCVSLHAATHRKYPSECRALTPPPLKQGMQTTHNLNSRGVGWSGERDAGHCGGGPGGNTDGGGTTHSRKNTKYDGREEPPSDSTMMSSNRDTADTQCVSGVVDIQKQMVDNLDASRNRCESGHWGKGSNYHHSNKRSSVDATEQELRGFLESCGCLHHLAVFQSNQMDLESCKLVDDRLLDAFGLTKVHCAM